MLTTREIKRFLWRLGRKIHGTTRRQQRAAQVQRARLASVLVEATSVAAEMRSRRMGA